MNSEMSYSIAHCIINKNDPIELQSTCLYSNCKLHIMCCTRAMYYISTCTCSLINNISSDESIHVCHYCIYYKINHTHRLFLLCCWDYYMHHYSNTVSRHKGIRYSLHALPIRLFRINVYLMNGTRVDTEDIHHLQSCRENDD